MSRIPSGDVAEELNEILRRNDWSNLTLPWSDFYELCGRERLKQPFLDDVQETASRRFQLIVAYGRHVVVVCHDRNFADIGSRESDQ